MKKPIMLLLTCLISVCVTSQGADSPDIVVKGLFKNTAILLIDGKQRLLKVGQTSPEGVYLIKADTKGAKIEYQGTRYDLSLSRQISTQFTPSASKSVAIRKTRNGSYMTAGTINGFKVKLLVDTGATSIAMNSVQAKRLGINFYRDGRRQMVTTASGTAEAYAVMLDKVEVGGIVVRNVRGSVIIGNYPREILLGMTYLSHVKMRENDGILYLEDKY